MSTADDPAPDQGGDKPRLMTSREIRRRIEADQQAEERLFIPSPPIERLLWQVCGAWETVIEQIRFFRYVLAEDPPTDPPFFYPDGEHVARDMRRIARKINVRLPSDTEWTAECESAKAMRDDLGHMLHFISIEGATPNQTVTLLRVPYREPDEMTQSDGWAQHSRRTVTITEHEARDVLAGLSYVNNCIYALRMFGIEFAVWPDGRSIDSVLEIMPWWLDDWGPEPGEPGWTYPTMRQVRLRPKAEYDAASRKAARVLTAEGSPVKRLQPG
ncbi:hypothetical protein OHB12_33755 [Nocardia sp. NBC_01730]|uniref:hypothetical protein n=1 Tax=Nocardia sp. NBC_01730 TaxID=2975998 RepID=UPI002E146B63|nr:hypothetical protein OHB12_33755 [Nocardia sp. NBC_01730]